MILYPVHGVFAQRSILDGNAVKQIPNPCNKEERAMVKWCYLYSSKGGRRYSCSYMFKVCVWNISCCLRTSESVGAKNVKLTDNKSKSIVFCVFVTRSTMLFSIVTSRVFMFQNFFNLLFEKSCIQKYNLFSCNFISKIWSKPPIRYP